MGGRHPCAIAQTEILGREVRVYWFHPLLRLSRGHGNTGAERSREQEWIMSTYNPDPDQRAVNSHLTDSDSAPLHFSLTVSPVD